VLSSRFTERDPLLAFLTLPKDWRLRGISKAYYIGSKVFEDEDKMGLKPGGQFSPHIEKRIQENGRVYFANHETQTTSWNDPRLSK